MSCPTCDHTMTPLGCKVTDRTFYWCPRCGTIKPCDETEAVVPVLVERCRRLAAAVANEACGMASFRQDWRRLGIGESINTPANRR